MRSPRVIYGVVAGVLVVAGFVLPRYLAGRSAPELGDTVVVPAPSSVPSTTPSSQADHDADGHGCVAGLACAGSDGRGG